MHFFNNYQFEWWEFGAASLVGAQFASEANVYEARPGATCGLPFVGCRDPNPCGDSDFEVSKIAVSNNWATSNRGYISSVGDLLLDDARVEVNEPARVFRPADRYPYTAEAATPALAARIRADRGARGALACTAGSLALATACLLCVHWISDCAARRGSSSSVHSSPPRRARSR